MGNTSRRELLRKGALAGAGIVTGSVLPSPAPASAETALLTGESKWDSEYNFGHTILFMEEYHQGTMKILGSLSGELEHIGELSNRAVSVMKSGGTVYNSANIGHMPSTEQGESRLGNPKVMKDYRNMTKTQNKAEMAEAAFEDLKKGDMIITNSVSYTHLTLPTKRIV